MMTPDINVLVAAFRGDHPHHSVARDWLEGALETDTLIGRIEILPMVAAGFLRIVTNRRVFADPSPVSHSLAFVGAILASAQVDLGYCGDEWPRLRKMCIDLNLSGNDIPDAWIAATVRTGSGKLVTFDRDFTRLLDEHELLMLESPS